MIDNSHLKIEIIAQDNFTADMQRIARKATVTKQQLDQDLLFKLRADAAAFDLSLKKAKEDLKRATDANTQFTLTMDIHQYDYALKEAKRKLQNYLHTADVELTKFQARTQKAKELLFKNWKLDSRLKPITLDPKDFQDSINTVKMYARDTKKEIDPLLHHKMTINVIEFQKNVERIKSLLHDKNLHIPHKKRIQLEVELEKYKSGLTEANR